MTDHDLATMVREHVTRAEPPFLMSADTAILAGRRALRRRRLRRGATGIVAAAAVAAVLSPLLPGRGAGGAGDDRTGINPLTTAALEDYDALKMPQLIEDHVGATLGSGLDGLGAAAFTAGDDQGQSLPPRYYDKASSMEVAYGGQGDRRVRVALRHSGSEAEGDARRICANDVRDGYAFSCTVATGADGDLVTTKVMAMRPLDAGHGAGWGALTRDELRTGVPVAGDPSQRPIDPAEVYFMRSVESVHSATFLTTASETVRAPDLATAESLWQVDPSAMATIVTDPVLVIPKPPRGDNGCAWMLHPGGISCAVDPN